MKVSHVVRSVFDQHVATECGAYASSTAEAESGERPCLKCQRNINWRGLRDALQIAAAALQEYAPAEKWKTSEPMKSLGFDCGVMAREALEKIGPHLK